MRSLPFTLLNTKLRLIHPVADCLFRQQCDASGAVMLRTWLQKLRMFKCVDFLV